MVLWWYGMRTVTILVYMWLCRLKLATCRESVFSRNYHEISSIRAVISSIVQKNPTIDNSYADAILEILVPNIATVLPLPDRCLSSRTVYDSTDAGRCITAWRRYLDIAPSLSQIRYRSPLQSHWSALWNLSRPSPLVSYNRVWNRLYHDCFSYKISLKLNYRINVSIKC